MGRSKKSLKNRIAGRLPQPIGKLFQRALARPPIGFVDFGDFDRASPIGENWGTDRGSAIDRHYIEKFLKHHAACIRGRVLEIGDAGYTRTFGGNAVVKSEIFDYDPANRLATFVGDLQDPASLPQNAFDCIILTQVFQYIFDLRAAVNNLHAALKSSGCLLITAPGIIPVEYEEYAKLWSFTASAMTLLLNEQFYSASIECETFGNVYAAISFLTGLALEEVSVERLDVHDERFPVVIGAKATKADSINNA